MITMTDKMHAVFEARLPKAQYKLDTTVMNDMVKYMPMQNGTFINTVRARSAALAGSGKVCAATGPMGRYLYEGKKMKNAATGKGPMVITLTGGEVIYRWPKGSHLVPTDEPLSYYKGANPLAGPKWFERAKAEYMTEWEETVREVLHGR